LSLRLESRLPPLLLWPSWFWTFVGAETLLSLWARVVYTPPGALIGMHFSRREMLFGVSQGDYGVLPTMIAVNAVVVLGLWVSYRSARTLDRRHFLPVAATTLAGAVILAAFSWSAVTLNRHYPPLQVNGILDSDGAGNYTLRDLAAR